jgi:hypothetical protein
MRDPEQMDKVKKQLEKLSSVMQQVEEVARANIGSEEDVLQVCGAMLAVTRNMYADALGPIDASKIFHAAADSFGITEEILELFRHQPKPTIH